MIARKAWRMSLWGGLTVLSLAAAILAAYSDPGARRLALGNAATASEPAGGMEERRLAETVRLLAADRDRLAARVGALERNFDDVTGSIPNRPAAERSAAANPGASPLPPALAPGAAVNAEATRASAPPPIVSPPAVVPAQLQGQTPVAGAPTRAAALAPLAADTGAAASTATKTEFGIDLGTAATVDGLRNLWASLKESHAPLLEGLRPLVTVRDGAKPGAVELRLVVGPLANAGVAARLCAALAAAGLTCAPAVFDGQRLALN
ncbi:MAG TPA: hypothetical protein VEK73_17050 [Xanthobacteraceae bacterium]|nr:hypothetical protein [Xanthobacteraceae bacterium]